MTWEFDEEALWTDIIEHVHALSAHILSSSGAFYALSLAFEILGLRGAGEGFRV